VAQLHPAPSGNREALSDVVIQDSEEGTKGGKKRCKQRHQETATMADDEGDINKQAGSSIVVCVTAIAGSGKHLAWPRTDHFEKLLEDTWPNNTNPIKYKLRDCSMMKNFIASGSLARGMEINEVPNEGDMTPFLREDIVMMIYDGHPSSGMRRVSNLSLGTPARCGWGCGNVRKYIFLYIYICRNIDMYITYAPKAQKGGRRDSLGL
jgi:hypothetical protein